MRRGILSKPCCVRVLKQIFILCYSDKDGALVLSVMWSLMNSRFFPWRLLHFLCLAGALIVIWLHTFFNLWLCCCFTAPMFQCSSPVYWNFKHEDSCQKKPSRREWKRLTLKHCSVNLCPSHISHHLCYFWWSVEGQFWAIQHSLQFFARSQSGLVNFIFEGLELEGMVIYRSEHLVIIVMCIQFHQPVLVCITILFRDIAVADHVQAGK
jgi:hypothetical protein